MTHFDSEIGYIYASSGTIACRLAMAATLDWLFLTDEGFPNHLFFLTAIIFGVVLLVHYLGETRKVRLLNPSRFSGLTAHCS